jgi:hypothetical protein
MPYPLNSGTIDPSSRRIWDSKCGVLPVKCATALSYSNLGFQSTDCGWGPMLSINLLLKIGADSADDADRLETELIGLREELLTLDVDDVRRPYGGPGPEGARSGDVTEASALLVQVAPAAKIIWDIVRAIRHWLVRRPKCEVRMEIAGDIIEVTKVNDADRHALIQAFIDRHVPAAKEERHP